MHHDVLGSVGGHRCGGKRSCQGRVVGELICALQGLGISSLAEFEDKVGTSPFADGEPLAGYLTSFPEPEGTILKESLASPASPVDLTPFLETKAEYLAIFDSVFEQYGLTAPGVPAASAASA